MIDLSINEKVLIRNQLFLLQVNDGDGLIVEDMHGNNKEEIRLIGIDAPESKLNKKIVQDQRETHLPGQLLLKLGRLSLNFLIDLIPKGTRLTVKTDIKDYTDIYGRTLAYVYFPDGRCINEILISEGYAKPYNRTYCSELTNYQILNKQAKNERKGLYEIVEFF